MQYKLTFFLYTAYINICLSYSSIHWCQFTFFSWHSCASILSKVLLFHAFINNGNLLKNRGVECVSIMGWTRLKQHFFRFFRVINTQWSHFCEKSLLKRIQNNSQSKCLRELSSLSVQNTLHNSQRGIRYNRDTCTKNENFDSLFWLSPDKVFLVEMTCFLLVKIWVLLCFVG